MKAPTNDEIKYGYDSITTDGPYADITQQLSFLTLTNPQLRDTVERMANSGPLLHLLQSDGEPEAVELALMGQITGALIYGLHLGLHIGEQRSKHQP